MFLNSLNLFRAIAILVIVSGHAIGITGLRIDSVAEITLSNLITGGTALFVFISGFLFHHVFYPRYSYTRFMKGKFKNVLIPYLILGIIPITTRITIGTDAWNGYFLPHGEGFLSEIFVPAAKYYWTGRFLEAYWYIPFIIVTFFMSPLHVAFVKLSYKYQIGIIMILSGISIFLHRPIDGLIVFQSVAYYLPIYLIGILCSINRDRVCAVLRGKEYFLLIIAVGLAFTQIKLGHVGNYVKPPFTLNGVDLMFIQKIFLCLFFLLWLERFDATRSRLMDTLASTSFAIFFLHPILIALLYRAVALAGWSELDSWLAYGAMVIFIVSICVGTALITKRILGDKSRYLIGY